MYFRIALKFSKVRFSDFSLNFRSRFCKIFSRGACEGPKFSRIKFSRPDKNPRNPRKFSPSKILGYAVSLN